MVLHCHVTNDVDSLVIATCYLVDAKMDPNAYLTCSAGFVVSVLYSAVTAALLVVLEKLIQSWFRFVDIFPSSSF